MEKALSRPPLSLGNAVDTKQTKGGTTMREIKFRAWDKYDKSMRLVKSVNYADDGFAKTIMVRLVDGTTYIYVHGESCELMQYTGLKDKNGKEIYEGDVIKNHTPAGENHSAYDEIGAVIWDKTRIIAEQKRYGSYFSIRDGHSEVIGNIYEHPHLLEPKGIVSTASPSEAEADHDPSSI